MGKEMVPSHRQSGKASEVYPHPAGRFLCASRVFMRGGGQNPVMIVYEEVKLDELVKSRI
jgi:hypothetical protein